MLEFDEASHRYTLDGVVVPSVTQLLRAVESFSSIAPDVLEFARDRGSKVHRACHLLNRGELDTRQLDDQLVGYIKAWGAFIADTGVVLIASESVVSNARLGYAGTLDALGIHPRGAHWLIDIKSGFVPATVGMQTSAYGECDGVREMKPARYSVQLRSDGTYRLKKHTSKTDFNDFCAILRLWRKYGRVALTNIEEALA